MAVQLVTGGAGFIGTHLVGHLLERGRKVRVLDNLDPLAHAGGATALPGHVEVVEGDLRDPVAVERALAGVDAVFHLGGVVGNGESMMNVRRACESNTVGTATLFEAVLRRRDRVRRVVVASSMVVYGEGAYACPAHGELFSPARPAGRLARGCWEPPCPRCGADLEPRPVREDAPLRPASVYAITKRDQEELALVLGRAYGLEVTALRYLNVYGSGQALANPYTGVAAIFAARALRGRPPLVFEDGGQLRDLVHVSDVVRATAAALDAPRAAGEAINVATGRRLRVLDLARAVVDAVGSPAQPVVTGEHRAGDIRHCIADTSRARDLLGFEARRSLERGLPELAQWVMSQSVDERGDAAVAELRAAGLVG